MWRAGVDAKMTVGSTGDDDDWETDPDFVVSVELRVTSSFVCDSIRFTLHCLPVPDNLSVKALKLTYSLFCLVFYCCFSILQVDLLLQSCIN